MTLLRFRSTVSRNLFKQTEFVARSTFGNQRATMRRSASRIKTCGRSAMFRNQIIALIILVTAIVCLPVDVDIGGLKLSKSMALPICGGYKTPQHSCDHPSALSRDAVTRGIVRSRLWQLHLARGWKSSTECTKWSEWLCDPCNRKFYTEPDCVSYACYHLGKCFIGTTNYFACRSGYYCTAKRFRRSPFIGAPQW